MTEEHNSTVRSSDVCCEVVGFTDLVVAGTVTSGDMSGALVDSVVICWVSSANVVRLFGTPSDVGLVSGNMSGASVAT